MQGIFDCKIGFVKIIQVLYKEDYTSDQPQEECEHPLVFGQNFMRNQNLEGVGRLIIHVKEIKGSMKRMSARWSD